MTARGCTEKQERASPSDAEGGARIFAEEKREMGHLLCFYLLELGKMCIRDRMHTEPRRLTALGLFPL